MGAVEAMLGNLRSPQYPIAYPPAAKQDDSEWEYEYDENETEDYYFTLDVTTHQSERTQRDGPPAKKRRLTRPDGGDQIDKTSALNIADGANQTTAVRSESNGKLQVLDLHGDNPLVLLDGQLYDCKWSTDLGSQFYVAKTKTVDKPRRSGRVLDVVGLSRARLTGSPITARPRSNTIARTSVGATPANPISVDEENHNEDDEDRTETPAPDQENATMQDERATAEWNATASNEAATPQAQARRSFLERLATIKQRKGETDEVPMSGIKQYELPSNQDEIRKASMAADAERERVKKAQIAEGQKRGPYKKKSTPVASAGKKSGPKPVAEVRSSLGLSGGNDER